MAQDQERVGRKWRRTGVGRRNGLGRHVAEARAHWRNGDNHNGSDRANDAGPEEHGLFVRSPALGGANRGRQAKGRRVG